MHGAWYILCFDEKSIENRSNSNRQRSEGTAVGCEGGRRPTKVGRKPASKAASLDQQCRCDEKFEHILIKIGKDIADFQSKNKKLNYLTPSPSRFSHNKPQNLDKIQEFAPISIKIAPD